MSSSTSRTAGSGYGLSLAARTLAPGRVHELIDAAAEDVTNLRDGD